MNEPRFLKPPPTTADIYDEAPDEAGFCWRSVKCIICGTETEVRADKACPDDIFAMLARSFAHQACIERRSLNEGADVKGYRAWQCERLVPEEFRKEVRFDFPGSNQTNLESIMAWEYGPENLWVAGPPGNCKTRFAWQVIKREYIEHNREFEAGTHSRLRARFLTAMRENNGRDLGNLMLRYTTVPILFVDDFGKGNITDSHEEWLYEIVDHRYRKGKPIIITAQISPHEMAGRMREDMGSAIMRRLLERVATVTVGEK